MNVEVLDAQQKPTVSGFIPKDEHESQTPETFFGGKPVLHYHAQGRHLLFNEAAFELSESLAAFVRKDALRNGDHELSKANGSSAVPQNIPSSSLHDMTTTDDVEVFITSKTVQLWSNAASKGLSLPYPSISLHAIQRLRRTITKTEPARYEPYTSTDSESAPSTEPVQALYLQLDPLFATRDNTNPDIDNQDPSTFPLPIEIYIIPQTLPSTSSTTTNEETTTTSTGTALSPTQALFDALSHCADLNPDPADFDSDDDDNENVAFDYEAEDGEGGATLGSGWITAENAHLYADRFADPEEEDEEVDGVEASLGSGAGQRRGREDEGDAERQGSGSANGSAEETKWQRTG